jgi:DNA-binding Lrp family transcriptional regulator
MDQVDKKILFNLLKDGRVSQRQIAQNVGISAQALGYRINKLIADGVIKGYSLIVSPILDGKVEGFAAFKSDKEYTGEVSSVTKCLEEITLYGFRGEKVEDVEKKIAEAGKELGEPVMKYIPPTGQIGMNLNSNDREIIKLLRQDPRMSVTDIAAKLDLPYMTVKRRMNLLLKNRLIGVVSQIDLSGGDVVIYSIFSHQVNALSQLLEPQTIFMIRDATAGVLFCYSENLRAAKESISRVRTVDRDADVMVLYDYQFFS